MTPWKAFHQSNSTLSCTSPRLVDRHSQRALDPRIFSEEAMALSIFPSFGVSLARTCCKNSTSSFAHISQTQFLRMAPRCRQVDVLLSHRLFRCSPPLSSHLYPIGFRMDYSTDRSDDVSFFPQPIRRTQSTLVSSSQPSFLPKNRKASCFSFG